MNSRGAWRDLWLVLTVVTTFACLASSGLLLAGVVRDPQHIVNLLTRLDWLASWPPRSDLETLALAAPPALAYLAWRFHRLYQDALRSCSDNDKSGPER